MSAWRKQARAEAAYGESRDNRGEASGCRHGESKQEQRQKAATTEAKPRDVGMAPLDSSLDSMEERTWKKT